MTKKYDNINDYRNFFLLQVSNSRDAFIMMPKMEENQRQKNLEKNIKKEWLEPIEDKDENK